jgi:hypothetical protein
MTEINREFLIERDIQIFRLRKTGVPLNEIAKRFGITTSAVSAAIQRQLTRMNKEALNSYPEVLRMELERLDALQQAIWPLTQHRLVEMPDGTQIRVDPDLKATAEVRAIINARAKLLGLEQTNVQLSIEGQEAPIRVSLAGHEKQESVKYDPEAEARAMLKLMLTSGIIDKNVLESIIGEPLALEASNSEIIDGEIVDV